MSPQPIRRRTRTLCGVAALALAAAALGCQTPPPVVNVPAQPCECACRFEATAPQIGRGCWVNGDVLVCPLVRRTLDIEPAYPSEDPRCEKLPSGELRCEIHPGDVQLSTPPAPSTPAPEAPPSAPSAAPPPGPSAP